jgi:hypothetical protein
MPDIYVSIALESQEVEMDWSIPHPPNDWEASRDAATMKRPGPTCPVAETSGSTAHLSVDAGLLGAPHAPSSASAALAFILDNRFYQL